MRPGMLLATAPDTRWDRRQHAKFKELTDLVAARSALALAGYKALADCLSLNLWLDVKWRADFNDSVLYVPKVFRWHLAVASPPDHGGEGWATF